MAEINSFTWIPFYTELAEKLLDYKDKREYLVQFVYSLGDCSNFIKKDDGSNVDDVDPYTVFAIFNRKINDDKRKQIAKSFKEYFSVIADIPEDFMGIPVMNPQKSVFFYRQTSTEQIPLLWDLFEAELNDDKSKLVKAFDQLETFHGIKWNLTMGMYWVRPYSYMPLDEPSRKYLRSIGIDIFDEKNIRGDNYLLLLSTIKEKIENNEIKAQNFPQVSDIAARNEVGDFTFKDFCTIVAPILEKQGFYIGKKGRSYIWVGIEHENITSEWHYELCADTTKKAGHDGRSIFVELHFEEKNHLQYETAMQTVEGIQSFPWDKGAKAFRINNDGYRFIGDIDKIAIAVVQELLELKAITIEKILQTSKKLKVNNEMTNIMSKYTDILRLKKNIVLQGAPGTGKTYNTAVLALSICDEPIPESHEDVMRRYDELQKEGRIGFCTFHQSMDYEDFVEGIKPKTINGQVTYEIESGIFKTMSENAKGITAEKKSDKIDFSKTRVFKMSLGEKGKDDMEIFDYCIENNVVGLGWGGNKDFSQCKKREDFKALDDTWGAVAMEIFKQWMQIGDIILVSYGNKFVKAIARIIGDYEFRNDAPIDMCQFRKVEWLYAGDLIPISKLYNKNLSMQSIYGFYDPSRFGKIDFNNTIKVDVINDIITGNVDDEIPQNYVLIIDEINRGNVSKIFGELITLLEADKRLGGDHPVKVTLPYSKDPFGVPSNLYIIGTMNTTDRSVGNIDYAVRRRFAFATLKADIELVRKFSIDEAVVLFEAVELFIRKHQIDMDFEDLMVGHSYFFAKDENDLAMKWQYEILPLLNEYIKDGIINARTIDYGITIDMFVETWLSKSFKLQKELTSIDVDTQTEEADVLNTLFSPSDEIQGVTYYMQFTEILQVLIDYTHNKHLKSYNLQLAMKKYGFLTKSIKQRRFDMQPRNLYPVKIRNNDKWLYDRCDEYMDYKSKSKQSEGNNGKDNM